MRQDKLVPYILCSVIFNVDLREASYATESGQSMHHGSPIPFVKCCSQLERFWKIKAWFSTISRIQSYVYSRHRNVSCDFTKQWSWYTPTPPNKFDYQDTMMCTTFNSQHGTTVEKQCCIFCIPKRRRKHQGLAASIQQDEMTTGSLMHSTDKDHSNDIALRNSSSVLVCCEKKNVFKQTWWCSVDSVATTCDEKIQWAKNKKNGVHWDTGSYMHVWSCKRNMYVLYCIIIHVFICLSLCVCVNVPDRICKSW